MYTPDLDAILGFVQLLAIGLGLYLFALVAFTVHRLSHPPRRTYASQLARGLPGEPSETDTPRSFQAWTLETRGLGLACWTIEGDDPVGPVCVAAPGWGDGKAGALVRLGALAPVCSRVVAFDSAGLGESGGICSLGTREVEDLTALIERVREAGRPLVVYGWSLGGGVALAGAARGTAIDGVIAEAPYRLADTPARNVLRNAGLPWRVNLAPALALLGVRFGVRLTGSRFDRAELAKGVACPVLVIHGTNDDVCPIEDGREIAGACERGEIVEIAGGGHNDLWTDAEHRAACAEAVQGFIRMIGEPG